MNRREQVRRWVAQRDRRGLTFRELSEETGVPVGTLASWAWKLRQEGVGPQARNWPSGGFFDLVIEPDRGGWRGGIEIVLAGGRRVVVVDDVDEDQRRSTTSTPAPSRRPSAAPRASSTSRSRSAASLRVSFARTGSARPKAMRPTTAASTSL